jgi:hypothetical protein
MQHRAEDGCEYLEGEGRFGSAAGVRDSAEGEHVAMPLGQVLYELGGRLQHVQSRRLDHERPENCSVPATS